jgi:hypothetical protein
LNKQERGKELATLVVSSLLGYPHIFNFAVLLGPIKAMLLWARALRDSVVVVYNNNFKQVLTLYPHKIKNTSATQMRGFKDAFYVIASSFHSSQ